MKEKKSVAANIVEQVKKRWRLVFRITIITICALILGFALFLANFPLAYRYTLIHLKRVTQFIDRNTPSHPFNIAGKQLSPNDFSIHGIDISHHNKFIKWQNVKYIYGLEDSLSFVFIKATEGGDHLDSLFIRNWDESKQSKLIRGAYHYFKPGVDAKLQAQWFLRNVTRKTGDLPPVIDVEESRFGWGYSLEKEVLTMAKELEKHYLVKPIIYTSHNFYEIYFYGSEFSKYPFWIARYNYHHRISSLDFWKFWQHSEKGAVTGISGAVDLNVYFSTLENLKSLTVK